MSNEARTAVITGSQQRGNPYVLMLSIAERAKPWGFAFPSVGDLACLSHLSERQVQNILHKLEAAGELRVERERGRGHVSRYWLLVGNLHTLAHEKGECDCTFSMEGGAAKGAISERKGEKSEPEKVQFPEEKVQPATEKVQFPEEKVKAFAPEPTEPREPTEPSTEPENQDVGASPPAPPVAFAKTRRRKSDPGGTKLLTEDFIAGTLIPRYADCWSAAEVRERAAEAMAHKRAADWDDKSAGVNNWLRRDATAIRERWESSGSRAPRCPRCTKLGRWPDGSGICPACRTAHRQIAEEPSEQPPTPPQRWGNVYTPPLAFVLPAEPEPPPLSEAAALWAVVGPAIRGQLTTNQWETWLADGIPKSLDGDTLTVALPTPMAAEHVPRKWGVLADGAAAWAAGRPLRVRWVAEKG